MVWLWIVLGVTINVMTSADLWKCARILWKQILHDETEIDVCCGENHMHGRPPPSEHTGSLPCCVSVRTMHCRKVIASLFSYILAKDVTSPAIFLFSLILLMPSPHVRGYFSKQSLFYAFWPLEFWAGDDSACCYLLCLRHEILCDGREGRNSANMASRTFFCMFTQMCSYSSTFMEEQRLQNVLQRSLLCDPKLLPAETRSDLYLQVAYWQYFFFSLLIGQHDFRIRVMWAPLGLACSRQCFCVWSYSCGHVLWGRGGGNTCARVV